MREFHVQWSIEVDAESPEEAARKCLRMQQEPGTTATVFCVRPTDDQKADPVMVDVDLLELATEEEVA